VRLRQSFFSAALSAVPHFDPWQTLVSSRLCFDMRGEIEIVSTAARAGETARHSQNDGRTGEGVSMLGTSSCFLSEMDR